MSRGNLKVNYLTQSDDATLNLGLFNNNNLVSIMTFGKNKNEYN